MNYKKYIVTLGLIGLLISMSCRDESLYPLPYNDRTVGGYLRMYKITSNVFDVNDLANSGFEVTWEAVDEKNGDNLQEVQFYVSFRRGAGLTDEVLLKTIPGTDFTKVAEPTYSEYKRATVRITAAETQTALATATATPPATWPSGSPGIAFPGTLLAADQIIYRWIMVLKDGREFTVANLQNLNPEKANNTPNITTGQFYSAPSIFTVSVRALLANSWVGSYSLTQTALWSPAHGWDFHAYFPNNLKEVLFPDQTVTLTVPAGGLSTEREFTALYRGQNVKMRINLENGTVSIPLQNSTVNCTSDRQLYWTMPASGNFTKPGTSTVNLVSPLPTATTANRGAYNTAITGTTAGNTFTIGVDDDCDEYGRRNGYCSWTRRIKLLLTKL